MKKLLLSLSLIATSMIGYSQTNVGVAVSDDFGDADAGTAGVQEYGTATSGVYWWKDLANPSDYTITRNGTDYSIAVTKGTAYSPIGVGFGVDGSSNANYIDMSGNKTLSIDASASTGAPSFYIQVKDINDVSGEVMPYTTTGVGGDAVKFGTAGLTSTLTTYTFDFSGGMYQATSWPCNDPTDWAANCPVRGSAVDFSKVKEVSLFISGGAAYTGTVTLDNFKLGCSISSPGVGTTCVASTKSATNLIATSKLYPNPVSDLAKVEMSLKSASDVKVTLSDLMGKEIMTITEGTMSNVDASFDVSNLKKGVYSVNYSVNGEAAKAELLMVK